MSLESQIEKLTVAVTALTAALNTHAPVSTMTVLNDRPLGAPVAAVLAPAPGAAPLPPTPAAPAAPAMPAFAMPQAVINTPPTGVPFTDAKGMLSYLMQAYQTMGPAKGAQIQGVLASIGVGNVNEVKPEQYAALHAGVEKLRAAA